MRVLTPFLVLAALAGAGEMQASRSFNLVYQASAKDIPAGAKQVRMWIPVPVSTAEQDISNVTIALTAGGATITKPVAEVGSVSQVGSTSVKCTVAAIEHGEGKSLCVESAGQPFSLEMSFDCTRRATQGRPKASDDELQQGLEQNTMVKLGGKVSTIAKEMEDGDDAFETGHMLYEHTLERMRYDKPEGGAWGRGDSEWACDSRFGNCTDFHSYFMALARTKGIPARFEMGFSVPGGDEKEAKIGGYHCWAYFYADGRGWVPVDISEADKHAEKAKFFFGNLDADRVTMTGGRDLRLTPQPAAGALNFLVYPYLEIDGKDASKTNVDKAFSRTNK